MKKPIIALTGVVVIVALYCGATRLCAVLTQERNVQMRERIMDQYKGMTDQYKDMIKVVSHKVDDHFFSSSEEITFEVNYPLLNTLLKNGTDGKSTTQFVVRNDIAYGPFPGFSSIGIARIETSLVLTDELRKKLVEVIGTDKPVRFFTTLGYFGDSYFDVISPKLDIHPKDSAATGTWKGLNLRFTVSRDIRNVSFSGGSPGLIINGKDNVVFRMDDIRFKGAMQRKFDVLFIGDEILKIGAISVTQQNKPDSSFSINDVIYGVKSTADDDFFNASATIDSGKFSYQKINFKEIHADGSFNHLDTKSTVALYKMLDEARAKALKQTANSSTTNNAADIEDIKKRVIQSVLTILQRSPVLTFDNFGFTTADGTLKITGKATIDGVTESDLSPTVQYGELIKKIHSQADVNIDQELIDHWPVTESAAQIKVQMSALESQGFITRKGDKLLSHLEYKDGKLTANDKQVGGR